MIFSEKWLNAFMKDAFSWAEMSKDTTKVGCVIVSQDKSTLSKGFNGFPISVKEDELRLSPEQKQYYTCHAEQNAMDLAKSPLNGAILVTTHFPCAACARSIIQKGIKTVYWSIMPDPSRWSESTHAAKLMLEEAGVWINQMENTKESLFAVVAHSSTGNLSNNISLTSECHLKTTSQLSTETQKVQIRWESDGLNLPEPPKGQKILRGL